MSQYIFYCDSVAPQTITLSFTHTITGSSLVTPPGWTSGKLPLPTTSTSTSTTTTSTTNAIQQSASSTSSHSAASPSAVPTSHTLSSGVIAAISLAAVATIAILCAIIFWCCVRPWMKKRKGLIPQSFPQDASHDGTYPWETPDSVEPKPQERQSIPYPGDHAELPTNSPRFLAADSEKYLDEKKQHSEVGSDDGSEGDINDGYSQSASHSRGLSGGEMSPVSPRSPRQPNHSIVSGISSTAIDRAGAVSPVSITSPRPKFAYLTPENAMASYTDDEEDELEGCELEGSPSFHTRNSMLRAEQESKRNSTLKGESKRNSVAKEESKQGSVAGEPEEDSPVKEEPSQDSTAEKELERESIAGELKQDSPAKEGPKPGLIAEEEPKRGPAAGEPKEGHTTTGEPNQGSVAREPTPTEEEEQQTPSLTNNSTFLFLDP
ncbi:MAG: hypothetical protein M1839_002019 [Geoglossum umbratile]|nr:MAG: hypothetical protein M1839_002019 [Geoglossum umbratile]